MTGKELFLVLTCQEKLEKADAVVLLEGDGFARIKKACRLIKEGYADKLIFSGASINLPYGSYPFDQCLPQISEQGIKNHQIIHESISLNTRQQAEEVINICQERNWKSIILVATHYHQFRAFLTFLKVLEERSLERVIQIRNAPVTDVSWFEETGWGKRIDLIRTEFEKIEIYNKSGHVSSYESALEYYQWNMSL